MNTTPAQNQTSTRLIEAGLFLFGHQGYEATSTRALAARADTNIASIAYHFGGKAGLRVACARTVATRISGVFGASAALSPPATRADALARIEQMTRAFVRLVVGAPEAHDMVAFMLRELTSPGEIADMIYQDFLEPTHSGLCVLWATATGRSAGDPEVKLAIFAVIGQVLYFRIAGRFVQRRMAWRDIGEAETRSISDTIIANLRGTIERQSL